MIHDPFQPKPTDPPRPRPQIQGLGDLVAAVAQPIAKAIDSVAGTELQHCQGCAQRKGWLNAKVPSLPITNPQSEIDNSPF